MPTDSPHYQVTLADALRAHDTALAFGGREGVARMDMLQSALGRPYHGYHETLHEKAAALFHAVISNHPFVDGNKRSAIILTVFMINKSGARLNLRQEDILDDFVVDAASGALSYDDITAWFKARIEPG